jgi:hypothetical protein
MLEMILENMLRIKPSPAFDKTDDNNRTVLQIALISRMPEDFILVLVKHMKKSELDHQDNTGSCAIDYLLDWEDVSEKVLQSLIHGGVNLSEQRKCSVNRHPLVRLCCRVENGYQLLKLVNISSISQELKNRMLEESIKRGSFMTAQVTYIYDAI